MIKVSAITTSVKNIPALKHVSERLSNGKIASAFSANNGSYGICFQDKSGHGSAYGKMMVDNQLVSYHATVDSFVSPTQLYKDITEMISAYKSGKCEDVTKKVLRGEIF